MRQVDCILIAIKARFLARILSKNNLDLVMIKAALSFFFMKRALAMCILTKD